MVELLTNLPENVVGVVASGEVTSSDYEDVLIPAIKAAIKEHGSIRVLYQLGPSFTGFTMGAIWDDTKVGITHLKAWEKVAVVTDLEWVKNTVHFLKFLIPCPVEVFPNNELSQAIRWTS